MKFGIYREGEFTTTLHATTVDQTKAEELATKASLDDRGTYIVAILGPRTPDQYSLFDPFRPRVVFRTTRS